MPSLMKPKSHSKIYANPKSPLEVSKTMAEFVNPFELPPPAIRNYVGEIDIVK